MREIGLDFVQLRFIIKRHEVHILPGRVLDEWRLLTRIGVNYSRRCNFQIKTFLYFTLSNNEHANH